MIMKIPKLIEKEKFSIRLKFMQRILKINLMQKSKEKDPA